MGKKLGTFLLFAFAITLVRCGGGGGSSGGAPSAPAEVDLHATPADQLITADLQSLKELDSAAIAKYDDRNKNVATAMFGAPTGEAIVNYFNERVKFSAPALNIQIAPEEFSAPVDPKRNPALNGKLSGSKATVIAMNLGTELWYDSILNEQTISFLVKDQTPEPVEITSPRSGLVVLAGGYTDRMLASDGRIVNVPPVFRQQTLMHEARHSDCTGGLSRLEVQKVRAARSAQDVEAFRAVSQPCGHAHVICPANHQYHGLDACDPEPWGAYQVGAVFIEATLSSKATLREWETARALTLDSRSRVLVPLKDMPDMTSAGLRDE